MPTAEIIAIGTELLLGEIQDTNSSYLARKLRDVGIDIFRTMTVGDNVDRIAQAIQEALSRAQIIITTGGLGPTVDDPTRDAVALALGVPSQYQPELWEQIQARFKRFNRIPSENNRRQAYIPAGAMIIENDVGTAPAFVCRQDERCIISLPGVPREMEYLTENKVIPYLREHFNLNTTIQTLILHSSGVGESQIDELIGDLENQSNPTVGLAAHAGIIDIRVTAKADSIEKSREMLNSTALVINNRLGDMIFGYNDETLEDVVKQYIAEHHIQLAIMEYGANRLLLEPLHGFAIPEHLHRYFPDPTTSTELLGNARNFLVQSQADLVLALHFQAGQWQQNMEAILISTSWIEQTTRSYGGPAQMGPAWCINTTLDFVRRSLIKHQ